MRWPGSQPDAPAGTVTLLFTDIESSSAQWEADPANMRAAVRRHDEILREVVDAAGGGVFKQVGDGVCAAFSTAVAGLGAAVEARQRLQDEPWPLPDRLRVRMGLHTGVMTPIADDYLGPPVNRAARVMAAANGDQIVCSAARAALCPELHFRDAGLHLLAGVGPERLFVLQPPGSSGGRSGHAGQTLAVRPAGRCRRRHNARAPGPTAAGRG
jgi:class 3 adenylate cyclase